MSTYISSLIFASQQITIYVGFFIFTTGLIGGPLVLIVFLSLKTFRQSSCAFYLTIMSLINTFHLFTGVLTYIMMNGFAINWTTTSLFYCKFRSFYVQFCALVSFTCMCLATIDQFFATCSNPRWHRWNNFKLGRYLVIGTAILAILHGIPFLLFQDRILSPITGAYSCTMINTIFQRYYNVFYLPVLASALPIIIMMIFGVLAYRNVKQIAHRTVPLVRRELDKQLTVMVLVQVFHDMIAVTPLIIYSFYALILGTPSDLTTAVRLGFIRNIANMLYFFHYVSSFYIYVCVSKRFRQQLIYVLFIVHLNRWHRRIGNNNQI